MGADDQNGSSGNRAEFRADTGAGLGQHQEGSHSAQAGEDATPCPQPPVFPEELAHGGRLAGPAPFEVRSPFLCSTYVVSRTKKCVERGNF